MKKYSSFADIKTALSNGDTSCKELVNYYLKQIESQKHLNVFLEVYEEEALKRAEEIDQKIAEGTAGKLAGMVIGHKDVICYKDHHIQAGSQILDGFVSQYSATVIENLLAEDAIIIGRQNCDEFAMGSTNENSSFGPTLNAAAETRVPGGSSGASASAIAADMCLISLGSDTGGSVRQPASFCGVVGLKPTYSRISRHGLIAYASSFDVIGILSHNVADAAEVLEVMAGPDEFDATVSKEKVGKYAKALSKNEKYKIGYIKETIEAEGISEDVKANFIETVEQLKADGHEVEAVDFPMLEYVLPTYYILITAEASTNLSRFDGVRYGYRSPDAKDVESLFKKSRSEGFGEEVRRRIMLGTFVLSASYYDAYFTKAQKVRRLVKEETEKLLTQYDFLISPTSPTPAMELGSFSESSALEMYLADLYTVQASVAGIPAISVPNGKGDHNLPLGIQIMAGAFEEEKLLAFAHNFEKNILADQTKG
ncbi:Asp-tRNA(Asn)/Glu-tRNA(Gln) amidotransferase subunit GatA [Flammeovirgaceae bacterium SG7u.111]|nr:Asp-tRNA(Asn)/Glu-tRNA(Gln) amidotransferase subunit GatA [Flammeovirgaceae bacterium SG7u.132]WPO35306.1 Asp-tRNA(Asn)/Glu-tRNA(Gln) amidotransferase subunit GatA [Flammeovirgaceae bacterium SG7u.111]